MFSYVLSALRWRTSRARIRRKASSLIGQHGDAALFRAIDLLSDAEARSDRWQVRFWQAVAHEAAHQIRRKAILNSIMCPLPEQQPAVEDQPVAPVPGAGFGTRTDRRDPTPRIRLVHPAKTPPGEPGPCLERSRRLPGRIQERQRWRGAPPQNR